MTEIFILDDQNPEDNAMLQALYSRSPDSVMKHLERVREVGSGNFMDQYYIGYNHASIGDCGTTTIFIENVSMLVAKAIQDTPLYSGQEASTRYLNMSERDIRGTEYPEGARIQERWMSFYSFAVPSLVAYYKSQFPRRSDEDPAAYRKAINAKAFDVMRGFLPAGCTTNVSWHTNLRQASDHLNNLIYHPYSEVRVVARDVLSALSKKYQHSFDEAKGTKYNEYIASANRGHLYRPDRWPEQMTFSEKLPAGPFWEDPIISQRPKHCRLPHRYDDLGQITYEFPLDFGSFRDLQRHRNGVCRMPLLEARLGFNQWYLDELPAQLRREAESLIGIQTQAIDDLPGLPVEKQPFVAMGFNVPCKVTRGLPGTLYLIELRTAPTVHPTMRAAAQEMATHLKNQFPGLTMYPNFEPNAWSLRRGEQDIVSKEQ